MIRITPGTKKWYEPFQAEEIASPALLVYPSRVEENIKRMISMAGNVDKLRPHVKTHKMSAIIRLKLNHNIRKFKCSTLSEVEMVAQCSGADILLAMQPTGTQISDLFHLQKAYPESRISVIADDERVIRQLSSEAGINRQIAGIWMDINNGMNRTGIEPGEKAVALYHLICELPHLIARGLHVYDGHIHDENVSERKIATERDFKSVTGLILELKKERLPVPSVIAGGTPTFPFHASQPDLETSPGTTALWDAGYSEHYPDLDFLHAAVVMTRVVSHPKSDLLCLDLGHKAIAAEMPHPRVKLIGLPTHEFVNHSEEHLVIRFPDAGRFKPGDIIFGIPWHICPTVPRYPFAYTIQDNEVTGQWKIDARDRNIS